MQGLWTVEFGSTLGQFGSGVVVLQDGRVMGGDSGYFYTGTYTETGHAFRATIAVTPFVDGVQSVFSTLGKNLQLTLVGTLSTDGASATAQGELSAAPQMRIGVRFIKRA
jgi:hypothetical protein